MELNPNLDTRGPNIPLWEIGQEGGRTRPIDRDQLFTNLCEIHEVLDKCEIRHWLSHGTMLGVYREGNFIPWDDDADLGLYFDQRGSKQYAKAIRLLEKRGFYIPPSVNGPVDPKTNSPYYDMVCIRNGEKVEGWFFEQFEDCYVYDRPRCGDVLKHERKYYDSLEKINFKGVDFNTPNLIEDWLVMMYGSNWKLPDKNAKYKDQTKG